MKKRISPIVAILALFAGCTTLNNPDLINTLARAAGGAAKLAAQFDTTHRAQYALSKEALDVLIAREQWDNASLSLALKTLPEVSDSKVALYVEGALLVYDLASTAATTFFKVDTAPAVKAFAIELRDGLAVGLAASAPAMRTAEAVPGTRAVPSDFPLMKRPPRPLQPPKSI